MILFFDTETTGLPNYRIASGHEDQPHCVQLAAILTETDGTERASMNVIIKPDGWDIPKQASDVHGITETIADMCGIREVVAAAAFYDLSQRANLLVAHNIKFDLQIIGTMYARAGRNWRLPSGRACTMEKSSPIVNLPPTDRMRAAGIDKPKAPKLGECYRHFFGEELIGAHDALVDVRACARLFFHIRDGVKA
ncbi:3'-5' exonuclease [Komagataeibacter melaceti]|uniref:3'-5' exonuclease n=1 Tax=Komagataeibacter melaceti TaxID=2766577 RepID=A0A371YZ23_9PROT|nr:3'-5' exonuclease [Komagataeibacter melaceti]RFD19495.1 3'-5' exonuclease [Komagataeibacter melaceti]